MMPLKTERLLLCPMTDEAMIALIGREPDAHLRAAYHAMLEGARAHPEARTLYIAWAITLHDGTLVGDLCFKGAPKDGEVELGYGILPPHQNRGYMTEAARAAITWALAQPDVTRVAVEVERGNAASLRVAQKLGLSYAREGEEGAVYATEDAKSLYIKQESSFS